VSLKTLVSTVAIAAAVAAPAANAHTLSKATAKREAAKSGTVLANSIGALGATVYDCTRRSEHAVRCRIGAVAFDGAICVSVVRVAYRNHKSDTPTRRVVNGPDCTPPELPLPGVL
jgi:hypothetical protein